MTNEKDDQQLLSEWLSPEWRQELETFEEEDKKNIQDELVMLIKDILKTK
jgi:hypothetical protein